MFLALSDMCVGYLVILINFPCAEFHYFCASDLGFYSGLAASDHEDLFAV